ncbi:M1 family metallopeptidase [Pedobacter sp. L105]|uniref:M1 family metallopeptidase n=1 Tax=Pedobacter sp. L105 TaxID=1641871 RepID=UPI00131D75F9|nr:M1 family metallopeptidase [Pedobacter sp. L105]
MKYLGILMICLYGTISCYGQNKVKVYTHADTLRGKITAERAWWDVLRYDITLKPDYTSKTIAGSDLITYRTTAANGQTQLQLDLRAPLTIDSILLKGKALTYSQEGNVWHVKVPSQQKSTVHELNVFYHGKVHEAVKAPWDGGFTFTTDSLGRPWMTVTCQGEMGASVWYPCKDHQSDEPDYGASLTMIVPDTLVAVANGRLQYKKKNNDGTATYKWAVVNPISNYCIIPYIGKYVNFNEVYDGEKGKLDLGYWVLDYNLAKAKAYMPNEVHQMLKAFEYWMGPYPFYEDSYKLVDVPHTGMEHQSAVAYGNHYKPGYRGRDGSGTGWGMKWDFIIVHESGHEWFGNNITTKDLADMWVHEGFTNYSETLYTGYRFGEDAADAYNAGIRKGIKNDRPIIPDYDVNAQGSGDMYTKGSNMLHAIRHSIDNDTLFRQIIRGLNKTFYHQTVTTKQIESYVSKQAGYDYNKVFDQYLRTIQIPKLEYKLDTVQQTVAYRWTSCVKGFNLPLVLKNTSDRIKIYPSEQWNTTKLKGNEAALFNPAQVISMYYISVEEVKP